MDNSAVVLLWLVLVAALAIPFVWGAWVILKRIKANEKTTSNQPESSEADGRDQITNQ